jgi:putative spermidine/putrescine transport system substrate-binding protein
MKSHKMFLEDCAQIAAEKFNKGRIDRRQFVKASAALGLIPALKAGKAYAATPTQLVHANWGGDGAVCTSDIYGGAFQTETGVPVTVDGSGPFEGTIKQMVETGSTIWDCADSDIFTGLRLGRAKLLEPIDYSIVNRDAILAPFTYDYVVLGYWYSYALTYDTTKVDGVPTWADFFDVEKIPGKRTMWKWMNGAVEGALLADGVPMDEIYPLDMDRALEKILSIEDHVIYWGSGAESQTMFLDEEVVMGNIWQTRSTVIERDTGGRVTWSWDQAIAYPAGWVIPAGNPAGAEYANRWIATMQDPALQIAVMECYGQGPSNPAALDLMTPEQRRLHPAAPENYEVQLIADSEYWAANYDDILNEFLDNISA